MTTYLQHPLMDDGSPWPTPPSAQEISDWEASGVALPEEYKSFLMKYNGGAIYPSYFDSGVPAEVRDELDIEERPAVDILFNWQRFLLVNSGGGQDWQHFMVGIGYDTNSSLIGISTDSRMLGSVVYWWRNLGNEWDLDDGPFPIGMIAPSFGSFLFGALQPAEHGMAHRWDLPRDLETAHVVSL